jgi:hypothetical protein
LSQQALFALLPPFAGRLRRPSRRKLFAQKEQAMTRTLILMSIVAAALGAPLPAAAGLIRFAGSGIGALINVDIEGGSYPDKRVVLSSTFHLNFSVDPVARSIFFHEAKVDIQPFTSVQTENFLVPGSFAEQRTITTTLDFDGLTPTATDVGPLNLISNVGTKFEIEDYVGDDRGGFVSTMLTGAYAVQGPTQISSGPFSIALPASGHPYEFRTDHGIVDFANFPASTKIDLSPRIYTVNFQDFPHYADIFSGSVDGIPLDVKMLRVEVQFAPMTAFAVPEPAACAMAMLACHTVFRRRFKQCDL